MARKLIIVGAGDVGGFVAHHSKDFGNYEVVGFLDDNPAKQETTFCGFTVLGGLSYLASYEDSIDVAIAIASPLAKAEIFNRIRFLPNLSFPSFIHPAAWLGRGVSIGGGTIVYPGVAINYETEIGDFCTINMNCALGHNCILSSFTTCSPGVNLGGFTRIGANSFIGIGASAIQGISVGREVTIGGMTMIIKDVPDGEVVVGNPARSIKNKKQ